MSNPIGRSFLGIGLIGLLATALAPAARAETSVAHWFSPNTPVKSAEVNANFSDLAKAVDLKAAGIEYNNAYNANCSPRPYDFCGTLSTTLSSMGSISVATPGPGHVLLIMSGDVLINDDVGIAWLGIGETATAFSKQVTLGRARVDYSNNLITSETFSVVHVTSVSAAGTHQYHALGQKNPSFSSAAISVGGVKLVAIFIPTRL